MGVYSRWGSIISLPAIDWGCIRNLYGWGCNQEWGSNRADTVGIQNAAMGLTSWDHINEDWRFPKM